MTALRSRARGGTGGRESTRAEVSRRRATIATALALLSVASMVLVGVEIDPRRVVAGDGHYVLAAARSLAYDGDLDLTNQYLVMGDRWQLGRDPSIDGWRLPAREIGASLVMVPGLWLHHLLGLAPRWEPTFACLLAAASLGPCWLGCARVVDATLPIPASGSESKVARRAELLAGAAVLGFVVPYYAVGSPGYAHAPDAAIGAWLCWALLTRRGIPVTGTLLACAVLTRLQNLLWLSWPALEIALPVSGTSRAEQLRRALGLAGLAALGLAPQLWLGLAHPGSVRGSIGWTPAFFNFADYGRDLARVLVGVHGLLSWTPLAALALVGLGLWVRAGEPGRERIRRLGPVAVLLGLWLLLASVRDVDGGDAFGARRLAGIVGILALGLAGLWAQMKASSSRTLGRTLATISMAILIVGVGVNLWRTHQAIVGELSLVSPDRRPGYR